MQRKSIYPRYSVLFCGGNNHHQCHVVTSRNFSDMSAYMHTTPLCLHMCDRLEMCKSHRLPSCREPCGSEWGLQHTSIHTGKLLSLPVVSGAHPGSPGRPELGRSVPLSIQSSGVLRKMTSQNMELRFTPPEAYQNFNSVVGWRRESYNYFLLFIFPFNNDHILIMKHYL